MNERLSQGLGADDPDDESPSSERFRSYLVMAQVPPSQRPWYAHWAQRFQKYFYGRTLRSLGTQEVEAFLGDLHQQPAVSPEQAEQASAALAAYYRFLGIDLDRAALRHATQPAPRVAPPAPRSAPAPHAPEPEQAPSVAARPEPAPRSTPAPRLAPLPRQTPAPRQAPAPRAPNINTPERPVTRAARAAAIDRAGPSDELLQRMRLALRDRQYAPRTEEAYIDWARRYRDFLGARHPLQAGTRGVQTYLEHLDTRMKASPSTRNQALNALVFFYKEVLGAPTDDLGKAPRAKRPPQLPEVLTRQEARDLLAVMRGAHRLMAELLYGAGLQLMECVRLRVRDVDFETGEIALHDQHGREARRVPLPAKVQNSLRAHLEQVRLLHEQDLAEGLGQTEVPDAVLLDDPHAATDFGWQYLFPSNRLSAGEQGEQRRNHLHENSLQKAVQEAARKLDSAKGINCHTLRHSFALHLLEAGYPVRTVQELMGHAHVSTTMVYTHLLNQGGRAVQSPLDTIEPSADI